jgi:hypothetical protein
LSLWQVIEGEEEAILGQAWQHAGDLGHRGIPDTPTTTVIKKQGGQEETGKNN